MSKWGDAAVQAMELLRSGHNTAEDAWCAVAEAVFDGAPESRRKSCARETFLGLRQAGLLAGVPASRCGNVNSGANRLYAAVAVRLLNSEPDLADGSKAELWRRVMSASGADPNKTHNGQMDVVLALWDKRWIITSGLSAV